MCGRAGGQTRVWWIVPDGTRVKLPDRSLVSARRMEFVQGMKFILQGRVMTLPSRSDNHPAKTKRPHPPTITAPVGNAVPGVPSAAGGSSVNAGQSPCQTKQKIRMIQNAYLLSCGHQVKYRKFVEKTR